MTGERWVMILLRAGRRSDFLGQRLGDRRGGNPQEEMSEDDQTAHKTATAQSSMQDYKTIFHTHIQKFSTKENYKYKIL